MSSSAESVAYLCARYSRFPEMQGYRDQLRAIGIRVQARWVDGEHEKIDGIATREQSRQFALDDVEDLIAADIVISFTENPEAPAKGRARGGRHVEFGMAWMRKILGEANIRLIVIGHRENVFHDLPGVEFYADWGTAYRALKEAKR